MNFSINLETVFLKVLFIFILYISKIFFWVRNFKILFQKQVPRSVPVDFGAEHSGELLRFFATCRKRGIGTDVEIKVGAELVAVYSFVLASFSDVYHEHFFPDFSSKGNKLLECLLCYWNWAYVQLTLPVKMLHSE